MVVAVINIWGHRVGAVSWDAQRKLGYLEFEKSFLKTGWDLAPILMPRNRQERGERLFSFPGIPRETFHGLPGLLADALPDYYGNQLIDAWLARQGRTKEDFTPVERLCYMGRRAMGALEFEPTLAGSVDPGGTIELEQLVNLAAKIMSHKESLDTRLGADDEQALNEIIRVGTSAGGARAKAVLAWNRKTGQMRSGQLELEPGFEPWLLKFDGLQDDRLGGGAGFGKIEYAYHKMALDAGIHMNPCYLLHENDRSHFMTLRFDRLPGNKKLHVQTLCGLAHLDYNNANAYAYEQVFLVMRALRLPYTDAEEMFRRMVFNVVARNMDDHTKNISFIMGPDSGWRLAPAYDLIFSYNPEGKWTHRHQLSINGKREEVSIEDLLQVAHENSIRKPRQIIEQVVNAVSGWAQQAADAGLDKKQILAIGRLLRLDILKN